MDTEDSESPVELAAGVTTWISLSVSLSVNVGVALAFGVGNRCFCVARPLIPKLYSTHDTV